MKHRFQHFVDESPSSQDRAELDGFEERPEHSVANDAVVILGYD